MPAGARRVRVHFITAGEDYQAAVEQDGSFYMSLPGDEPIRFELLDERGQSLASEEEWVWLRKGEQRICTGCHAGPERVAQNRVPEALRRITHDAQ